jgi:predicted nucleotidyltransferase
VIEELRCDKTPQTVCKWLNNFPCLAIALAEELRAASVSSFMRQAVSPHISIDRDAVSAFCRRHHIRRLALFGSVLRDDFRPDSDVDVLVVFQAVGMIRLGGRVNYVVSSALRSSL